MPKEPTKPAIKIDTTTLLFLRLLEEKGLPLPQLEFKFHPTRKWRLDYAWVDQKLAVEREGGIWSGGRHTRPAGFLKDLEKYNSLTMHGWKLLRFTPSQIVTMDAIRMIAEVIKQTLQNK